MNCIFFNATIKQTIKVGQNKPCYTVEPTRFIKKKLTLLGYRQGNPTWYMVPSKLTMKLIFDRESKSKVTKIQRFIFHKNITIQYKVIIIIT